MTQSKKIDEQLKRLVAADDWTFAVGLRIRFNHPTLLYQTYPEEWIAYYAQNGLMFSDPTVLWGMTNLGIRDWDDLQDQDSAGVLTKGREFGLVHGIVVSVGDAAHRSIGFFAHASRPIGQELRDLALDVMNKLHELTENIAELSPAQIAQLAALNDKLRALRG